MRGRQEVGQRAREHGAEAEPGEVALALRRERADAADLDPHRAEVGEPRERERGDGEGPRVERRLQRPQLRRRR